MADTRPTTHRVPAQPTDHEEATVSTVPTVPVTEPPAARTGHLPLTRPRLPRWAPWLVAAVAAAASALAALSLGWGLLGWAALAVVVYGVALPLWSLAVESSRAAKDRLVGTLVWVAFALAMLPLASLLTIVVKNGIGVIDAQFLTYSMRNVVGEGGGIYHAILGTLMITLAATVISVPVGLLAAVYLVEYGRSSRLARTITFFVDVMTGIPSIVAGLFAYALFVLFYGPGVRMGIGGSVALSLLMIPIVVRSCEEMLKLVPAELREAAYALGVPKWRTIVKVVLPTAIAGLATGITLSVARVVGETAPLLLTVGIINGTNLDPFDGRMASLPVFAYYQLTQPGFPPEFAIDRAWTAALLLIVLVMALNIAGRLISRFFAPTTGR